MRNVLFMVQSTKNPMKSFIPEDMKNVKAESGNCKLFENDIHLISWLFLVSQVYSKTSTIHPEEDRMQPVINHGNKKLWCFKMRFSKIFFLLSKFVLL